MISAPQAANRRLDWAQAYTSFRSEAFPGGLALLVVDAARRPLTAHGVHDATTDLNNLADQLERWPFADFALAVPETVVVLDLDEKNGKHGLADFGRLDGRDPHLVDTPQAISPSGGLHLLFATMGATYPNAIAIKGTGVDIRTRGGYIVLPGPDNGRHWLKRLSTTPLEPAPAWLADALYRDRPVINFSPVTSRKEALAALEHALFRIISAPAGEQESTRHAQCFKMGVLIAEGVLDYATARVALVAAAEAMPAYGAPWRKLEAKVEASIERGIREGGGDGDE
jgi:hypothetical protein